MKRVIRATTSPAVTQRELTHRALAREICAEGVVLLENNGALPLREKRVALYGLGARRTSFGGVGSGETSPREAVSVEKGLENAGFEVTSKKWLDDYDREYDEKRAAWREGVIAAIKKYPRAEQMDHVHRHPFVIPAGREITAEDVAEGCGTAIYVLTRHAGEGSDRRAEEGDYLVTPAERRHLDTLCELYENVILVTNVGGLVDLSFVKETRIAAVVHMAQGGMESGSGLADVLSGAVSPSGKLTDTWAVHYGDYPGAEDFAYRGDPTEEDYNEGIYVGYRYFDAFGVRPLYPFGYGLSYTSFSLAANAVEVSGRSVTLPVTVTNTGDFSGKEVVQLYVCAPRGALDKERKRLAAFGKTKCLEPGESDTLRLSFDMAGCASFSESESAWMLEKGDYILRFGASGADTRIAAALRLGRTVVTERVQKVCPLKKELSPLLPPVCEAEECVAPVVALDADAFRTVEHEYIAPEPKRSGEIDRLMAGLTLKDMATLVVGAAFVGPVYNTTFGAIGKTTSALVKKGIQNLAMADGPQGLNLMQRALRPRQNFLTTPAIPEILRYGLNKAVYEMSMPRENDRRTVYYQFCTAWPCPTMLAQTWNTELAERMGYATGIEMIETGVTFWLAPALNIHRNVLCGRNFEYYSEDPLLSGRMAAAVVRGTQSHEGCYAVPKHFACNNQETERQQVSANLSERALREIYLKGFEITVKESSPKAFMTSYNRINGVYTSNSHDLVTKVLRCEWGFDGLVMTDWYATGNRNGSDALCFPAGGDLIMPGSGRATKRIIAAVRSGEISRGDLERSVRRILKATLESRMYM